MRPVNAGGATSRAPTPERGCALHARPEDAEIPELESEVPASYPVAARAPGGRSRLGNARIPMIRNPFVLVTAAGFLTWGGDKSAKGGDAKAASAPAEVVTLLEPGKEPRKALRYKPTKGDKCRAEIDGSAQIELKIEA